MNFLELVNTRQSCRNYSRKAVPRELVERCLEAARLAPSACNSQPWRFMVVEDDAMRAKIAGASSGKVTGLNTFAEEAPILIVIVTRPSNFAASIGGKIKGREYRLIDIGIAAEHFCLQAAEEGLGTCMLGWYRSRTIGKILKLGRNEHVDLLITLGYPEDAPREKKRRALDAIREYW